MSLSKSHTSEYDLSASLIWSDREKGRKLDKLEFYILNNSGVLSPVVKRVIKALASPQLFTHVSGDTASERAFFWAQAHLQKCIGSHNCSTGSTARPLPARVLDLGLTDDAIRLYEPRNKSAPYICLSHCWGSVQLTTTTTTNINDRKKHIPCSEFPPTFRDAIVFTKKLGIRFLWIDSLCIIQDDTSDWRRESGKMCSIYENALLVLAASKSYDSLGGLFSTASPHFLGFPVPIPGETFNGLYVRRRLPHDPFHIIFIHTTGCFPLSTRAWAFQERLLAARVLHFGTDELLWECKEGAECECSYLNNMPPYGLQRVCEVEHERSLARNSENVARWWREMAEVYSGLHLTYPTDKLPALSGLARQHQRFRAGKYVAGLWEDSLIDDMLWFRKDPVGTERTHSWRAPSWAWTSVEGEINYPAELLRWGHPALDWPDFDWESDETIQRRSDPKILEIQCMPTGPDPTGELLSAHLVLSAYLVQVQVFKRETKSGPMYGLRNEALGKTVNYEPGPDYWVEDAAAEGNRQEYYCLRMRYFTASVSSLVLRRVAHPHTYERVGLLHQRVEPFDDCLDDCTPFSGLLDPRKDLYE